MKTKFFLISLLLFTSFISHAQEIIINGEKTNRGLLWSDFSGKVDKSSSFYAETFWNMSYTFKDVKMNADTISYKFIVTLELGNRSWSITEKQTAELLKHEQGHFDIARICMNEIITSVAKARYRYRDFSDNIKSMFRDIMQKYKDMEKQYDDDSDHSKNKPEQERWNELIRDGLAK